MSGLSVSRLVRVTVNLSPLAAARRSFGVLMIAGDSDVINGKERFRTYTTIDGVVSDFGVNAPEYKAAALYFGQSPKPKTLMVGRWLRTATPGMNIGGILSLSEQSLSNWTSISNGNLSIAIDGTVQNLTGLDFTLVSNLNGVAAIISAALTGATCVWTGSEFKITSATTGAGVKASGTITLSSNPSPGVRASGTITVTTNPSNGDTLTIQGTTITFVTGTPGANQVQIGATEADTAANLQAFLQASSDVNLALMTYSTIGTVVTVTARVYSTAGNAYTLAEVGGGLTLSGATLAGGVNPDTLTVNGVALTFVASAPSGNQILVGPTAAATSANIQAFLAASVNVSIAAAEYSTSSLVTTVTYKTVGTAGNAFTLAESSAAISVSGATLSGGAAGSSVGYAQTAASTDLGPLLKMTSSLSQAVLDGYDAESPVECAAALANKSPLWYGLMFQASTQPNDSQNLAVSDFIEAQDLKRIFGVTITNTNVLSALVTNDLASLMKDGGYRQSFCQYSENAYAIASLFGRMFSVDFNANRSTITLMYKQEPSVAPEDLTENQATILKGKRCNVFVNYINETSIVQYGVMSGPAYIDEIHGLDWFQDAVQNACYNVLYTSLTKVPQTDAGVNQLTNAVSGVCDQAVNNGLVAPGVWNSDGFGTLAAGQYLKNGYYIFAESVALQSQSDRDARVAPPIQVALKLAGAIQEVDVIVNVNR